MKRYERLSAYAERMGLTYQAVWRQYKDGKLPQVERINGNLLVPIQEKPTRNGPRRAVIYARVSSSQNRSDAISQAERLEQFAIANGWIVEKQVIETASGMNESRPKLWKILNSDEWDILLVEHKDRLTRFGFTYLDALISAKEKELVVVNRNDEEKADLLEDLTSVITSFCARIYGQRRSKRKTEQIIQELQEQ